MLRQIMRHDAAVLTADRSLRVVLAVFGLCFVYAVGNGLAWARFQQRTLAAIEAEDAKRMADLEAELVALERGAEPDAPWLDPRAPNVLGGGRGARQAALPPGALAALAIGQSDLLPYYYTVSIWTNDQSFLQNGELENPINLLVGPFDLAFVLVFVLPLSILALTYNVLSGEREQGTLAMTLAQPVRLRTVVGGKIVLRAALVVGLALATSLVAALATSGTTGGIALDRLALWSVAVTIYALFWFGLAVAVNAAGRGSAWNASALVGAWIVLVVVLPSVMNIAANLLHPLPSRVDLITAQREASNDAVNRRSELLARYFEDHPEMARGAPLDTTSYAAKGYAAQEEVNRRLRAVTALYDRQLEAQRRLIARYRFLSPALLLHDVLNDAAGTGDARFAHFRAQVAEFADRWKAFFVPRILSTTAMRSADIAGLPAFGYREEAAADVRSRVAVPLLALAALASLVWLPALRALGRYRLITGVGVLLLVAPGAPALHAQEGTAIAPAFVVRGSPTGMASEAAGVMDLPRLRGPIEFDGVPGEAAWDAVEPLPLTMYSPTYRGTPGERTELRVAYDDRYLYVGARLYERDPSRIAAYSLTRDRWNGDDTFGILLDTFNDNENAVRFVVTPLGVRLDYSVARDGDDVSETWDTFWDVRTRITDEGWTGELRIPFSSLRFAERNGEIIMGMNVYRWTTRANERVTFPAIPSTFESTKVSIMQDVRLRGIAAGAPVYVTPYALSGLRQNARLDAPAGDYGLATTDRVELGGDVKLVPSRNLTLDLSVNTDFADVEVDQQQVNLTRFSLFFPEKRPFFLERAGLFDFSTGSGNGLLFHSRNIGLVDGEPIRILGGVRAVGRFGGLDVGALTMQTARHVDLPSENFAVVRLRQRVLNPTSYVGAMATSRIDEYGRYNMTYGVDATAHPVGDEYFTLKWLQTFRGGEGAADATGDLRDSRIVADWSRRRVRGFSYSTTLTWSGPGYDPGIGFETRRDFTRLASDLDYQWFLGEDAPLRRVWIGHWGNVWTRNADDRVETAYLHPFVWIETKGGATFLASTNTNYDDTPTGFSLSDDAVVPPGDYWMTEAWLNFGPPDSWNLAPIVTVQAGEFYDGTKIRLWTTLIWRASAHLELLGDYQHNRIRFDARDQRFDSHLLGLQVRAAWNARLSASVFMQYNNTIDQITSNARIRHNFSEGRDLWIVWNEALNTDRDRLRPTEPRLPFTDTRTLTVKYTHALIL